MKRPVFYPPCQYLDPDRRNASGWFWCELIHLYVRPAKSYKSSDGHPIRTHCAPDCKGRHGTIRRATF